MKLNVEQLFEYFAGRFTREAVEEAFRSLSYIPSDEFTDNEIAQIEAALKQPAKPTLPGTKAKGAIAKRKKGEVEKNSQPIEAQNLSIEKQKQMIDAAILRGVADAEALISLRNEAFIETIKGAEITQADNFINASIEAILKSKSISANADKIIDSRIVKPEEKNFDELLTIAETNLPDEPWAWLIEAGKTETTPNPWDFLLGDNS